MVKINLKIVDIADVGLKRQNTALIIIDVQKGFDEPKWGVRNNLFPEENIAKPKTCWRCQSIQKVYYRNC